MLCDFICRMKQYKKSPPKLENSDVFQLHSPNVSLLSSHSESYSLQQLNSSSQEEGTQAE